MTQTIQDGKVVGLAYLLKDSQGVLVDQADQLEPFYYIHGQGQIVPGLENALLGLNIGAKKDIEVSPEEGYGEVNPSLVMTVKKSQFPGVDTIHSGMQFQARGPEGHGMIFTVVNIENDDVTIDGNHPMAGKTLNFAVEVLSVRDATEEEMSHGHVHGPDGHHHH